MSRITSARNTRHFFGLFQNRKTLWQMIRETLSGRYKMSMFTTVVVILSLVYVLFPFDMLPDYIPFLGWIDDAFVFFLLVKMLQKETSRYVRFKAMERKNY